MKRSNNGVMISKDQATKEYPVGIKGYINRLCYIEFRTYEGIVLSMRKVFGYMKLPPIYINKEMLLISFRAIREYDVVFINYHEIYDVLYLEDGVTVIFYDETTLILGVSTNFFRRQLRRCENVLSRICEKK